MVRSVHRAAVWSGPTFFVLYLIAFGVIAGYLPPPSPSMSAAEVSQLFDSDGGRIRLGLILGMIFCTLLFPFFGVISMQIARIEGSSPILAVMQFGAGVLLIVFFFICHMLWIALTFRHTYDPNTMQQMNDLAWLTFVMVFPTYVLQMICIAIAALAGGQSNSLLPRWYGYFCLWVALGGCGGAIAVYFTNGPFAWDGLIGFWIPIALFAIWLCLSVVVLLRAVDQQFNHAAPDPTTAAQNLSVA